MSRLEWMTAETVQTDPNDIEMRVSESEIGFWQRSWSKCRKNNHHEDKKSHSGEMFHLLTIQAPEANPDILQLSRRGGHNIHKHHTTYLYSPHASLTEVGRLRPEQ